MKKLAIIITHPIQYYTPVFSLLAKQCRLKVFYTWGKLGANAKYDPDFRQIISWDIPLLDGYDYEFLINTAKAPGSNHYNGIINPDLNARVESFSPDAIFIYGWAYKSHLCALRYFKGKIPLWFRGDSTLLNESQGLKEIVRSLFLKWVYSHVDKAFYAGSANKTYFKKFGLKRKQLCFLPHAVDNERFSTPRSAEALSLRHSLNISETDLLILFAGKFEQNKNPSLLIKAFNELNINHVHLLLVGNGPMEERLKLDHQRTNFQNTLSSKIHFMAFQNQTQMPVVYQACDLFCLPSQSDTWGLAVNEAMACGKAILVSDKVGCASDLVKKGINGEIFESGNCADLTNKLQNLTKDKIRLIGMGRASKKIIQDWSFEAQSRQILRLLNEAN
ncbi:glycosyltransferase family 4 protein [Pedobacter sp. Leaf176]|uniref:glycosyltransferase family 4 protein n=1 Tax=Pedobacter sp. Leaf176 TaxID=1736286 RepID=UPI0006F6AB35|nr:glycosyltransferase family 4 protein [Pedobacter sp. Leaf176]KQR72685.1 glycosyl transferase family 1 [Pedobacter sp. Leaf176]